MASGRLLFVFFLFSSSCFASSPVSAWKVPLALYYETLCPYCSNFIVNYLAKIFENGLIDIVDLDLIPYGNARVGSNGTISCQHGPNECVLNTVEACTISAWPDVNEHFSFIYCIESLVMEHEYLDWESCFSRTGLDSHAVMDCYKSGYGKKLELQYASQTDSLQPPHTYVPWVVVDGQPLYDDYENFEAYVCKAYGTGELPKACAGLSLKLKPRVENKQSNILMRLTGPAITMENDEMKIEMII
ncbi:gamma-interferon-responsive lysosomal thiol protein isoform X1 [Phoenix dactylifera]|uniref:Gamma-interferon-responsive lysosomal thiol protein isoform X1 n=1 Tax=Phoenix dactylifera TaxID=42345 RepID=A0A8B9ATP3_PHODC|nr:gamma-interferon-responsive lysosomal thiol protein isoform X1 [Phoenix dactylifera]